MDNQDDYESCIDEKIVADFPFVIVEPEELNRQPANCILCLQVTVEHSDQSKQPITWFGTAFLVSENEAVTAAHNFSVEPGQKIRKITAIAEYGKASETIVMVRPENIRFHRRFYNRLSINDTFEFDYSLIKLQKAIWRQKYLEILPDLGEAALSSSLLASYGYPRLDNNSVFRKIQPAKIFNGIRSNGIILQHKGSSLGGQSGSPILIFINGQWFVIGIHKGGSDAQSNKFNLARLFTSRNDNIYGNILFSMRAFSEELRTPNCKSILADKHPFSKLKSDDYGTFWDEKSINFKDFIINRARVCLKPGTNNSWHTLISKNKLSISHSILIRNLKFSYAPSAICFGIVEQRYKNNEKSCNFDGHDEDTIGLMISKDKQVNSFLRINDSTKFIKIQIDLKRDLIITFELKQSKKRKKDEQKKAENERRCFVPNVSIYSKLSTQNLSQMQPLRQPILLDGEYYMQNEKKFYAFVSTPKEGTSVEVEF